MIGLQTCSDTIPTFTMSTSDTPTTWAIISKAFRPSFFWGSAHLILRIIPLISIVPLSIEWMQLPFRIQTCPILGPKTSYIHRCFIFLVSISKQMLRYCLKIGHDLFKTVANSSHTTSNHSIVHKPSKNKPRINQSSLQLRIPSVVE
jgi:hypothetical protein